MRVSDFGSPRLEARQLTRSPALHVGKVRGSRGLAAVSNLNSAAAEEGDGEASRGTNGLLGGGDETVQTPFIEGKLLNSNAADAVSDDEGVGGDLLDSLNEALEVEYNTGRGVDVGSGDNLVLLLGQGLGDVIEGRGAADGTVELGHIGTVLGKAVTEAVTEVAAAEDEGVLASLDKVSSDEIPTNGAGTVDNVGLSVGVGRADDLAKKSESLAEGLDEARSDVALASQQKVKH